AGGAMVGSLFAADAWTNVTFTAGEVREPRRTLPLSLILGVGGVVVLYFLANVAYLTAPPIRPDAELEASVRRLDRLASAWKEAGKEEEAKVVLDERQALLKQASPADLGIARARDDRVGTAVMEEAYPNYGVRLMAAAIMVSLFGCANGLILMGA